MKRRPMNMVFLGLSITSSWGNGHATTYRGLVKGVAARGHQVLFLERDVPWYANNRDMTEMPGCDIQLYQSLDDLRNRFADAIRTADFVMVGSYVPEGVAVGEWVLETAEGAGAFYDIDTPVTLADLEKGRSQYISRELIPRYPLYLSFTGGPMLERMGTRYGAQMVRPLYCSVDPEVYFPEPAPILWDMGYLGTYCEDRQHTLDELLIAPAAKQPKGRFVVAGPQYPAEMPWPDNVKRTDHLPPSEHRRFYNQQRFTLNITRRNMLESGFSPSVRLFEAAACGTPIITDYWNGLEEFFEPGTEVLVARNCADILQFLSEMPESERIAMSRAARSRTLASNTAAHRAAELEGYILELMGQQQQLSF